MTDEPKVLIDVPNNRKKLAWGAMILIVAVTGILMTELVLVERIEALMPVLSTFYFTMGSIISVFIGGQFAANALGKK